MRRTRLYKGVFLLALVCLALQVPAQRKSVDRGPRAIGIVRWMTNAEGKAVPVVVPVVIRENGKYYDAGLYKAAPAPMTLESGVVYEAQDQGKVVGYFTIQAPRQYTTTRQWVGFGSWEAAPEQKEFDLRDRPQTAEVVRAGEKAGPLFRDAVDDRDMQKKKTTEYDEEGHEISKPADSKAAETKSNDDDRPKLKRPNDPEPIERMPRVGTTKETPKTAKSADDDPDRPKMKRETQGSDQKGAAPSADGSASDKTAEAPQKSAEVTTIKKIEDADPNRPVLRRGRPQERMEKAEQEGGAPVPARIQSRGDVATTSLKKNVGFAQRTYEVVAVSDAADAPDRLDFRFRWKEDERAELTAKMQGLAEKEVEQFLMRTGPVAGVPASPQKTPAKSAARRKTTSKVPAESDLEKPQLQDMNVVALDLNGNNVAVLVFTGSMIVESATSSPTTPRQVFATVVARLDVEGNPRKLFSGVTSSDRLDVTPRLELIDAVDADGDGRGELLFRSLRDATSEFAIYRVDPDKLTELYRGGNAQ